MIQCAKFVELCLFACVMDVLSCGVDGRLHSRTDTAATDVLKRARHQWRASLSDDIATCSALQTFPMLSAGKQSLLQAAGHVVGNCRAWVSLAGI